MSGTDDTGFHTHNNHILDNVERLMSDFKGEYFLLASCPSMSGTNIQLSSAQGREFLSRNLFIIANFIQFCYDSVYTTHNSKKSKQDEFPEYNSATQELNGSAGIDVIVNNAVTRLERALQEDEGFPGNTGKNDAEGDTDKNDAEGDTGKNDAEENTGKNDTEGGDVAIEKKDANPEIVEDGIIDDDEDDDNDRKPQNVNEVTCILLECTKGEAEATKSKELHVEKEESATIAKTKMLVSKCKTKNQNLLLSKKNLKRTKDHVCEFCGESFKMIEDLKKHLSSHQKDNGDELFKSDSLEDSNANVKVELAVKQEEFVKKQIDSENLKCLSCDRVFRNEKCLEKHIRNHEISIQKCVSSGVKRTGRKKAKKAKVRKVGLENAHRTLECPCCLHSFKNEVEFLNHLESHSIILLETCTYCGKKDQDEYKFLGHILHCHMKTPRVDVVIEKTKRGDSFEDKYRCPNCEMIFDNIRTFILHLNSYSNVEKIQCSYCNKVFTHKSNLRKHLRYTHSNKKTFICDVCGKSLKQHESLKLHRKRHDESASAKLKCDECGKWLSGMTALKVHMRGHTGSNPYMCDVCGKAFKQYSNIQKHMLVHTNKMAYKCDICNKEFKYQDTYKCHMTAHILKEGRVHGARTQFSAIHTCEHCGKQFSTAAQLKVHLRTHTNERPYKCQQCDKAFKEHGKLSRHMKTHKLDHRIMVQDRKDMADSKKSRQREAEKGVRFSGESSQNHSSQDVDAAIVMNVDSAGTSQGNITMLPLPSQGDNHLNIVPLIPNQGQNGQTLTEDSTSVLLHMIPSTPYEQYVTPPPQTLQVPQTQLEGVATVNVKYEEHSYFRTLDFSNNSL